MPFDADAVNRITRAGGWTRQIDGTHSRQPLRYAVNSELAETDLADIWVWNPRSFGERDQVNQLIGFAARKFPRVNQLHPVKCRPVAAAVVVPPANNGNAFVQELDYASVANHTTEEHP